MTTFRRLPLTARLLGGLLAAAAGLPADAADRPATGRAVTFGLPTPAADPAPAAPALPDAQRTRLGRPMLVGDPPAVMQVQATAPAPRPVPALPPRPVPMADPQPPPSKSPPFSPRPVPTADPQPLPPRPVPMPPPDTVPPAPAPAPADTPAAPYQRPAPWSLMQAPFAPSAADLGYEPDDAWGVAGGPDPHAPRATLSAEWLYWASTGQRLPVAGGPAATGGARSGFRLTATGWAQPARTRGVRADFLVLGTADDTAAGGPLLINARNDVIGGGLGQVLSLAHGPDGWLNLLSGYRYLNVRDRATVLALGDFRTSNHAHAAELGLDGGWTRGRWFVGGKGSLGVGVVRQTADSAGGHVGRSRLGFVPEAGLRAGASLSEHARVHVGYNVLYVNTVVRAAEIVRPAGTPTDSPTSGFLLHGLTVGFEWQF